MTTATAILTLNETTDTYTLIETLAATVASFRLHGMSEAEYHSFRSKLNAARKMDRRRAGLYVAVITELDRMADEARRTLAGFGLAK